MLSLVLIFGTISCSYLLKVAIIVHGHDMKFVIFLPEIQVGGGRLFTLSIKKWDGKKRGEGRDGEGH